ncbi:hypothetical protein EVAR_9223_1 [Eumeta japonica]|uniref:Uncharacterized protein n=1 Tax=Eumeta variegata TaxID=151549 RepID=A0A4C2AH98_EUMVA|nr:hypothetical protein EVAR_9223_1 [Eumeta japonica]
MSRRVTETMPRGTRCPFKRGAEAGGRSETGVLAKARQERRKARQTSNPDLPLKLERAASRCRGRQRHRKSPAWSQEGSAKPGAHRRQPGGGKITALTREARDELEALRNISREVKTSVCENCSASLRSPLASKSLAPPHSGGGTGEDQEGSRP